MVPGDIKIPRIANCAKDRNVGILFGQKLSRQMIADLAGRREEFLDNLVHERAARSR
jgi:hypothetical protein